MSYCRWSSDDFRCDLYIYESIDGFQIHVASNRFDIDYDVLPPAPDLDEPGWAEKWTERNRLIHEAVDLTETIKIDLPYAGESFSIEDANEAADKVEELIKLGYHVPDGVVQSLRESVEDEL